MAPPPRARADLTFHPQKEDHGLTMVHVRDSCAAGHYRLSPLEVRLLRAMDGKRDIPMLAREMNLAGFACNVEFVAAFCNQCARLHLLVNPGAGASVAERARAEHRDRPRNLFRRIFFFRIPLVDPHPILGPLAGVWGLLVRRQMVLPFCLLLFSALYLVLLDLPRLAATGLKFLTPAGLPWFILTTLALKLAHELGHAAAARRHGCRVHEMGLFMLIFVPCFYVDTSEAWTLPRRKQRLEIGLAGILVDLGGGALAAHLWFWTAPGTVNSIAFFIMTVSWVASLFFNANPLMRFDGYYLLADALGLPNLATKGAARLRYLFWYGLCGVMLFADPAGSAREGRILTGYGIGSAIYRLFLGIFIAQAVYTRFYPALGALLMAAVLWQFLLGPLLREGIRLWRLRGELRLRSKPALVAGGVMGLVLFLFFVPISKYRIFTCVLTPEDQVPVVSPLTGVVEKVCVRKQEEVAKGQLLVQFSPRGLKHRRSLARLDLALAEKRYALALTATGEDESLGLVRPEVEQARDVLQRADEDLAASALTAEIGGRLFSWREGMDPGALINRGELLGRIGKPGSFCVSALLEERELAGLTKGQAVQVWLPFGGGRELGGRVSRIDWYSAEQLQDSPLAARFGGDLPTQRGAGDRELLLTPYYKVAVELAGEDLDLPVGITGRLLVPAGRESLWQRFWQASCRRLFREGVL